ncbi:phage portal protein [Enterococcus hirae]|uniref:phage portal protein n=1 Tax=Enterococcus hirae TaxID=1354 RepID=UPI001A013162|nr:phage portal protein [Enterococcus hirae]
MGIFMRTDQRSISNIAQVIDYISMSDVNTLASVQGETALLQSDIFTAVRIIASDIASSEIVLSKGEDDEVLRMLNNKPNDHMTAFSFKYAMIANLLLTGNAYALVNGDQLTFLKPSQVTVQEDEETGEIFYSVMLQNSKTILCDENEIIHFKSMTTNGKKGISPLYSLKPELNMLKNGNHLLASFFKKGVQAGGILSLKNSTLNNKTKKQIRKDFEEVNAGAQNAGGVIVLDETQEFKRIEIDTKVLEMIQNNVYSTKQIAKTFGIPLSRFGMEMVNTSETEANDAYISSTLNGYKKMMCQELDWKLGIFEGEQFILFDMDFSTLQGRDRNTMFTKMIEKNNGEGVLTINEVREFYGKEPVQGGNEIYKNSASIPIEKLLS